METTQLLLHNYVQLPANLQTEVLHYVEFLLQKAKSTFERDTDDLTQEQKDTLVERYNALKKNPERGIKWADAKKELLAKIAVKQ